MSVEVHQLVDHLFRHKYAQVVAGLTRLFGPANLDLAESVAQEALLRACETWPYSGVPKNPAGWIMAVAKNHALDIVRREQRFRKLEPELARWVSERRHDSPAEEDAGEIDDQLRMIFLCCHPALTLKSQVALTLKTVCGFSIDEIARALLSDESAARKLVFRAKQTIVKRNLPFELPGPADLPERTDAVLTVFYLIFNEGYSATAGESLVRSDLCEEAIRLTELILQGSLSFSPKVPTVKALLALELFQYARVKGRTGAGGELLLLSEQDRTLWDRESLAAGLSYLADSAQGDQISPYHLQAHIAACHAVTPSYEECDWRRILSCYDRLMEIDPGPIVALNRAVAVGMVHGPEAALQELVPLTRVPALRRYHLLAAAVGDCYRKLKQWENAAKFYRRAHSLAKNETEKRHIASRIRECLRPG